MEINEVSAPVPVVKKGSSRLIWLLVAAAVVALLAVGTYWYLSMIKGEDITLSPTQSSEIRSNADLTKLEKQLDETDLDALDDDLAGNDSDAADF